jgi:hypothetical protein
MTGLGTFLLDRKVKGAKERRGSALGAWPRAVADALDLSSTTFIAGTSASTVTADGEAV